MNNELKGTLKEAVLVQCNGSMSVFAWKDRTNENPSYRTILCHGQASTTAPPKYKSKALLLEPACSLAYNHRVKLMYISFCELSISSSLAYFIGRIESILKNTLTVF